MTTIEDIRKLKLSDKIRDAVEESYTTLQKLESGEVKEEQLESLLQSSQDMYLVADHLLRSKTGPEHEACEYMLSNYLKIIKITSDKLGVEPLVTIFRLLKK